MKVIHSTREKDDKRKKDRGRFDPVLIVRIKDRYDDIDVRRNNAPF
jgi:hypothetical protein